MNLKQVNQFMLPYGVQVVYENETEAPGFSLQVFYPFLTSAGKSHFKKYRYGVEIQEFPWEKGEESTINNKPSMGDTLIVRDHSKLYDSNPMKTQVKEITDKTILFLNLDSGYEIRKTIDEFYSDFEILEVIEAAKGSHWKTTYSHDHGETTTTATISHVEQ